MAPHRLLTARDEKPNMFGICSLVPNSHRLETEATLLLGRTQVLASNFRARGFKIRISPEEGPEYGLYLLDHHFRENEQ